MSNIAVGFIVYLPTNEIMLHLRGPENDPFPHTWAAIGGHEESEDCGDLAQTLIRELKEELALDVQARSMRLLERRVPHSGNRCEIYLISCETKDLNLEIREGIACQWFGFSEALELDNLAPVTRADLPAIEKAVETLRSLGNG